MWHTKVVKIISRAELFIQKRANDDRWHTWPLSVIPFILTHYKSLVEIGTYYSVAESELYIGSAVLNFNMDTAGRRAVDLLLMDVQKNFNGERWTQNGPEVLDRVLYVMCGTEHVSMGSRMTAGYINYPSTPSTPLKLQECSFFTLH